MVPHWAGRCVAGATHGLSESEATGCDCAAVWRASAGLATMQATRYSRTLMRCGYPAPAELVHRRPGQPIEKPELVRTRACSLPTLML